MVAAAYPAVKDEAPESVVLVGGLAAHGRRHGIPPLEFLRDLACVDGRLRPVATGECADFRRIQGDGFAHHPYSTRTRPDQVERSASPDDVPIARIRRLIGMLDRLAAAGRISPAAARRLHHGVRVRVEPARPRRALHPERAARMMAFGEALAAREPRVRTFAQFIVRDLPGTGAGGQQVGALPDWQSGLLFTDRRPKPLAVRPARAAARRAGGLAVRAPVGSRAPGRGPAPGADRGIARRASLASAGRRAAPTAAASSRPRSGPRRGTVFRIGRREAGRWVYGPAGGALR